MKAIMARLRRQRRVRIASVGAPISIPIANPVINIPACGMVIPRSSAISGSSPASISSLVPCAKIAYPITKTASGIGPATFL
jgi:hypothetical protein